MLGVCYVRTIMSPSLVIAPSFAVLFFVAGCGGSSSTDAPDTADVLDTATLDTADATPLECPPAPLDWASIHVGAACMGPNSCSYAWPTGILANYDDCNTLHLDCVDGGVRLQSSVVACRNRPPRLCPADLVEGASCSMSPVPPEYIGWGPYNPECFLPTSAAPTGAAGEIVAGKACACDVPGPIWRCRTGSYHGK